MFPLKDAIDHLAGLFAADPALAAWALDHFGRPFAVFRGVQTAPAEEAFGEFPAAVIDVEGATFPEEGANACNIPTATVGLVWVVLKADTDARSFSARLELEDILPRTIQKNRKLGGAVDDAAVDSIEWDRRQRLNIMATRIALSYWLTV